MSDATAIQREQARLWALQSFRVLDTPAQGEFDDLVRLAGTICGAPIALVSLVDRERLWFKARVGLDDVEQIPRSINGFCDQAIRMPTTLLEVADARLDPRFADNALVNGELGIRFYAAAPLKTPEGEAIGTFCVLDRQPRSLNDSQRWALAALSRLTMELLAGRRRELELQRALAERDYRLRLQQRAKVEPGSGSFAVAVVCIDNLKGIQNCFADAVGDRALQMVAQVIDRCVTGDAIVSRYGRGEFLVILCDIPRADAAAALEQARAQVEALALAFPLSVSIGAAIGYEPVDSIALMYERADQALAQVRAAGGNRALLAGERLALA